MPMKRTWLLAHTALLTMSSLAACHTSVHVVRPCAAAQMGNPLPMLKKYASDQWARTKGGFTGCVDNWKQSRLISARMKYGDAIPYSDWKLMQRVSEDNGRLVRLLAMQILVPSMLIYYVCIVPGSMPSTFELPRERENRIEVLFRSRREMMLNAVMQMEGLAAQQEQYEPTSSFLKCRTQQSALQTVQSALYIPSSPDPPEPRKFQLGPLSKPLVAAAFKATGGSKWMAFLPRPVLTGRVKAHLGKLGSEDDQLRKLGDLRGVQGADLREICLDRGIGFSQAADEELQVRLRVWIDSLDRLQKSAPVGYELCPLRSRLALMGWMGVEGLRAQSASKTTPLVNQLLGC